MSYYFTGHVPKNIIVKISNSEVSSPIKEYHKGLNNVYFLLLFIYLFIFLIQAVAASGYYGIETLLPYICYLNLDLILSSLSVRS